MQRILITGMSGVGKSTVINELAARGYSAVDADSAAFSHWVAADAVADAPGSPVEADRDWVWQEDRIRALLATEDTDLLFVSGTAANMGQFLPQFDQVILLSAPVDVIVERLAARTNNPYGKTPAEVQRVIALIDSIEPLLRRIADHEIDTSVPLDAVVARVLALVQ
jgi:dephospho-CoA kinase